MWKSKPGNVAGCVLIWRKEKRIQWDICVQGPCGKRELSIGKIGMASCPNRPGLSQRTSAYGTHLFQATGGEKSPGPQAERQKAACDLRKSHHLNKKGFGLDHLPATFFPTECFLLKTFCSEASLRLNRVRRDSLLILKFQDQKLQHSNQAVPCGGLCVLGAQEPVPPRCWVQLIEEAAGCHVGYAAPASRQYRFSVHNAFPGQK